MRHVHLPKRLLTLTLLLGITALLVGQPAMVGAQTGNPYGSAEGALDNSIYVAADGKVGIGTTEPTRNLTVRGGEMTVQNSTGKASLHFGFVPDGGSADAVARLRLGGGGAADNGLLIQGPGSKNYMRIWHNRGGVVIGEDVSPPDRIGGLTVRGGEMVVEDSAGAALKLGFHDDVARVRVGGAGAANNGLLIQGPGEKNYMRIWHNRGGVVIGEDVSPPDRIGGLTVRGGEMVVEDSAGAALKLGFHDDVARVRVGGAGAANNGLLIQGPGEKNYMRIWHNRGGVVIGEDVSPPDRIGGLTVRGGEMVVEDSAGAALKLGFHDDVARIRVGGAGAANNGLRIAGPGEGPGDPLLRIWGNGHVGIGTSVEPQTGIKFEVNGGGIQADRILVEGTTTTSVLQITGGADIAEPFAVNDAAEVEPGTVVILDADNPGELRVANGAYDPLVAGIISGAGDIQPGLIMQQEEEASVNGEMHPVALTGKVYVKAVGPIQVGDLLTTCDVAGHAMAATDREKAFGATLGKAMSPLDEGTGLVLVLVALQ
ncbi:hypothetical protein KFU94_52725 [Chloroflexi bacterium TSY]|nr:hypothetical protein [Chloroflexi bacterium TSY]